jgi:23S rRNA pseudouridine2605 synthase
VSVDPDHDQIQVDGRAVSRAPRVHLLFNKPQDILCTCRDPRNRRTFQDFVKMPQVRLYPVGRLDRDSEGLLLLTNDGDFAQGLMHPRYEVPKIYHAWVAAPLDSKALQSMLAGVESEGERLKVAAIRPLPSEDARTLYEIVLHAGRNRHIRRMFEALGAALLRLKRVGIGPLRMKGLRVGQWRPLTEKEVFLLRQAAQQPARGAS